MEPGRILRRERRYLAELLGVTLRTVQQWADARRGLATAPLGRPRTSRVVRGRALRRVRAQLELQGKGMGWRTVEDALYPEVKTALVQDCVRAWKQHWSRKRRRGRARRRVRTHVLARDVLWAEDATQVGRVDGAALQAEVVRDAASTRIAGLAVGAPACAQDVIELLAAIARERGGLPLVLALDNGGANKSRALQDFLERVHVVLLRNVPHVPQHNAFAERAHGELKQESGLASDSVLHDMGEAIERLAVARARLDGARRRTSRGGYTAKELDTLLPRGDDLVVREDFWAAVRANVSRALQDTKTPRARRLAEREAILATMEDFGLIQRIRGDAPLRAVKGECVL
jgi:transposase InsO family protein